ncbi:MAG: hypothetical protein HY763_14620 [Planctomycetes bacterium]|nr:hypothetical protein [Planctomycetota bacterium]
MSVHRVRMPLPRIAPTSRHRAGRWRGAALAAALWCGNCRAEPPPTPVPDAAGNYLRNAGFEEAGERVPAGWTLESRVTHKGGVSRVATAEKRGSFALRLAPNEKNAELVHPLAVGQGFAIGPFRGRRLRLEAELRAEGDATAVVGLYAVRADGKITEGLRLAQNAAPSPQRHEGVFAVPDDEESLVLVLSCAAEGTSGAATFDDVFVGEDASDKAALKGARAGAALTAEVNVDASRAIRVIPRTLYGANIEWIYDGYGLWDADKQELRPELGDLARELGVTLLRFPGGVFSDFYHWKDGVGPQDSRRQTPHHPGGPKSRHSFGTEEALSIAGSAGGSLLITVNAGTGTAEEAADWVRYVNAAAGESAKTRPAPRRRVDYWEVGNELYGKGGVADRVTLKPEAYADRFREFAHAMREADTTIKIGAIGGENFGAYKMNGYPDWNAIVLARTGGHLDFLAIHNAYAPLVTIDRGYDARTVYAAMLAAPKLIAGNLQTVSQQIDRYAGQRAPQISIAVTEWGPWFHADPDARFVDHVKTLASALFAASTLKVFIESPRVEVANFFKLVDNAFLGWIGLRDGRYVPKAPYYALQMYTQHFGSVLVHSTCTGPTYDSQPVGVVDGVRDVSYLEVVASLSGDEETLYVLAINKHFEAAIAAGLRIDGFAPLPQAIAWTLTGTAIDANTGTQLPQIPGLKWGRQTAAQPEARFQLGGPGEVELVATPVDAAAAEFTYVFPPHSVTSLQLRRAR